MSECIEWQGYKDRDGYGMIYTRGDHYEKRAHRVAYCEAHGLVLEDIVGQVVRHKCDNPACVNPDHLVLGTSADNSRDMVHRQRQATGERHGRAKLTSEQVSWVRLACIKGCPHNGVTAWADRLGVSKTTISNIVNGRRWRSEA